MASGERSDIGVVLGQADGPTRLADMARPGDTIAVPAQTFGIEPLSIRKVELDRPWLWLHLGWRDFCRMPGIGMAYGFVFIAAGMGLAFVVWATAYLYLLLPMMAGFMLLGPLVALGLYDAARRYNAEATRPQSQVSVFLKSLAAWRENPHQLALMGLVLVVICLIWLRVAAVLFALFFADAPASPADLLTRTIFTVDGFVFLVVGTAAGALLAGTVYAISVVSFPLLLDRDVNFVAAMAVSVMTLRHNFPALALWAALVVVFTSLGLATLFIGLAVCLPLIGFASWHAYQDLIGDGKQAMSASSDA